MIGGSIAPALLGVTDPQVLLKDFSILDVVISVPRMRVFDPSTA